MSPSPAEVSTQVGEPLNSKADLSEALLVRRLPGRNRNKADLFVYQIGEELIAVKDYAPRPWWIRHSVGRFFTRRESLAYRASGAACGLPRFLGRLGPFALATEFIAARTLAEFADGTVAPACFDTLRQTVIALHERGLALADLNHRDVLLTASGEVYVIDLATAWILGERPGPIRRRLFDYFKAADLFSLARMRARFTGEDREQALRSADPRIVRLHRIVRRIKWRWDRLRGADRLPPVDDHWR